MVSHLSISFKINLRASIAGSRKDYALCAGHYPYVSAKAQIAIRLECVRDGLFMAICQSFRISRMPILSSGEYFRLSFRENTKGVIHVRAHVTKYTSVHFAPTLEKWKMGKCRKCRALSVMGAGATFFLHPMK